MLHLPDFQATRLAEAVEGLSPEALDQLPFGVIKLDPQGVVQVYNREESLRSGRGGMPAVGLQYFIDVAPCMDNGYFKGRIEKARAAGVLNISFEFIGDFNDRNREISVRVQAAKDGGSWIFTKTPEATP
ncbi:MAG: hypothetical protein Q8M31_15535 [Beijerinckiaceae bacterium]|nr:hypothetical protein [Beijerinckiaceae bacterium]